MANTCFTEYILVGPKKDLDEIYGIMKGLQNRKESLLPNGWGKTWLGNFVHKTGGDAEKIYCRGKWCNLKKKTMPDGEKRLCFNTETAWTRMEEVDKHILEKWPAVKLFYLEEESGNEVFETNDKEEKYFPEQYILDIEDMEMDYFTKEGALKTLSNIFGEPIASWEEALKTAEEHNDKADENNTENHVWLHKFELA